MIYVEKAVTNEVLDSYNKELAETEPKYTTAQNGVQENPDAPPEIKEMHTIEPPKVSTQHF